MNEIIEILKGNFKITQIIIENFTNLDSDIKIKIEISSNDTRNEIITFENVTRININSDYYSCSDKSSILIEDLSSAQMEGVRYEIAISEDVMSFYCKNINLGNGPDLLVA